MTKILLYIFIFCFTCIANAQSISVNDSYSAQQLVENILVNSSCATTSNPTATGDNFTPGKKSYAYFNNQGGSFPFAEGVLLSTWSSTNSEAPYVANVPAGDSNAWLGDSDLNSALGKSTINATVLEFDFTPLTNFLSFDYLFASNEYQSFFPCSYSDAFAFLIKESGSTGPYQNLAVIPNTTTPVSSINVHPLIPAVTPPPAFGINGCPAINDTFFAAFNTSISPINYAGQTVVLNAKTTVIPNKTYHIKLVIADNGSTTFNSAVFIKAGSFTSKIDLGSNRLFPNNPICYGENFIIDTKLSATYSYKWYKNGSLTPISGEISPSLNVTDTGIYKVEVELGSPNCIATGEVKIQYTPELILTDTSLTKCDDKGNGTATFDLTKAETVIKNTDASLTKFDYYETQTGLILSNPISNPTVFTKTSPTDQLVYAKVTSNTYGCTETAKIILKTITSSLSTTIPTASPIVNDFSGNSNSVQLIPPSTGGPYEFSLDGTNYRSSPLFTDLAVGNYVAYIRDSGTCEYLTYPIILLDYPRYFTPNGDGYNDFWEIKNLDLLPKFTITIFDRYGKLLQQFSSTKSGWNGTFNGYSLPADDYWFNLIFEDNKTIKGHFSLKR